MQPELQPNFSGIWKIDFARSTLFGGVPQQILVKIEHGQTEIIQRLLITDSSGIERLAIFAIQPDGETANTIGAMAVLTHAHWEAAELVIESKASVSGREIVFRDYWSVSADGKTLTMAHRDDALAGQISVFERGSATDATGFDRR